jgi:hypothetical protein
VPRGALQSPQSPSGILHGRWSVRLSVLPGHSKLKYDLVSAEMKTPSFNAELRLLNKLVREGEYIEHAGREH